MTLRTMTDTPESQSQHSPSKKKKALRNWMPEDVQCVSYIFDSNKEWSLNDKFIDALVYVMTRPKIMWYQADSCDLLPHDYNDVVDWVCDLLTEFTTDTVELHNTRQRLMYGEHQPEFIDNVYRGVVFGWLNKLSYQRIVYGVLKG